MPKELRQPEGASTYLAKRESTTHSMSRLPVTTATTVYDTDNPASNFAFNYAGFKQQCEFYPSATTTTTMIIVLEIMHPALLPHLAGTGTSHY